MLETLIKLLHPFMPFITEKLYSLLLIMRINPVCFLAGLNIIAHFFWKKMKKKYRALWILSA